ncbi:MAG: MtnX-like HAD-IB family phosphatase [Melioribacteraceae bacterium]|nr:MtnX-like HAD-IB family phosphatase [Melioribacteraceae bacterium]MCO6474069.1 MtnX-like HAD-IB family phosphatase [Melioribacteraceae bacterium]
MEEKIFKVFIDFDGTVTKTDVGEELFLRFGDPHKAKEIISLWMEDKITSVETWERLCETVENLNRDDLNKMIDEIEIDDYFHEFLNYCESNNIEVMILSDGLDYYIDRILTREKLSHLNFVSNKVEFGKNNEMLPSFPYTDEECSQCANCKRNHVIANSGDDEYSVYIGDGYSDKCPAQYCDFIFAKKSLLKYCEKNRISYFPYSSFADVLKIFKKLQSKKRLRKRHQAELKRKEVYAQG